MDHQPDVQAALTANDSDKLGIFEIHAEITAVSRHTYLVSSDYSVVKRYITKERFARAGNLIHSMRTSLFKKPDF